MPMRCLPSITIVAALIAVAVAPPVLADVRCGGAGAVRVGVAPPPPLPENDQPPMPAYGYAWTPGSWYWNPDINDYYWTPGAWILPPAIGLLWTPGYWGWDSGAYLFHAGYWGPHVGFYGGVRYGFGYWGHGYDGGYWRGRTFYYNRAYNNIGGLHINALYDRRVADDRLGRRTSFNGGPGGVVASERADERLADHDAHIASTTDQARHLQAAAGDPGLRASVNHGHPLVAGAAAHATAMHAQASHGDASHAARSHIAVSHASPSHAIHSSPAYRHQAVQPRHATFHGHYAPAYRTASHAFHAEPLHWGAPRSGPVRQGPPRGERR